MMFIMGLGGLIVSICALFPGSGDSWLARQFSHVDWEGLHFEDTIFALFLFISGMTFPFSIAKKRAKGMPQGKMLLDIIRRGLLLFLFGLIYDGLFDLQFATQRIPSVLGRIGLGWSGFRACLAESAWDGCSLPCCTPSLARKPNGRQPSEY